MAKKQQSIPISLGDFSAKDNDAVNLLDPKEGYSSVVGSNPEGSKFDFGKELSEVGDKYSVGASKNDTNDNAKRIIKPKGEQTDSGVTVHTNNNISKPIISPEMKKIIGMPEQIDGIPTKDVAVSPPEVIQKKTKKSTEMPQPGDNPEDNDNPFPKGGESSIDIPWLDILKKVLQTTQAGAYGWTGNKSTTDREREIANEQRQNELQKTAEIQAKQMDKQFANQKALIPIEGQQKIKELMLQGEIQKANALAEMYMQGKLGGGMGGGLGGGLGVPIPRVRGNAVANNTVTVPGKGK